MRLPQKPHPQQRVTFRPYKQRPYYLFRDREDTARKILEEFGLNPDTGHIITGHVPVKVKQGESPVKAEG